ncbi:MAG: hypothetical protein ACRD2J_12290 [Thermoanaerobaculia bacterium]
MRNHAGRLALALVAAAAVAAVAGRVFFYFRDNFSTHLPYRAVLAAAPAPALWNPLAGGGQPLAGNPNALAFYPDSLLYAILPLFVAFNLHFLLHWIAGGCAMYALLRRRELPREAAVFGALLWIASGAAVSSFAFYNLVTGVALVPFALWAAEGVRLDPGWRTALPFGAAFGLLALAGEPVTLLGTALAAGFLLARAASRRTVAASAGAVAIALVIAAPLLLAWNEIAGETERGVRAYSASTVLAASLTPWQLVELVLGPVRGLVTDASGAGWRASGAASPWPPLFLTLQIGAVALPAVAAAPRRFRREQLAAGVLLLLALGRYDPIVAAIVRHVDAARLLRYPEKLALPLSALVVVLVAAWMAKETRTRADRLAALAGAAGTIVLTLLAATGWGDWSEAMRSRIALAAAVALPLFALAASAAPLARRGIAAATLVTAGVSGALALPVDRIAPYRETPPLAAALAGKRIARIDRAPATDDSARIAYRRAATTLDPVWGSAFDVAYALEKSPDGMYSYLSRIAHERFRAGDSAEKARWAAIAGVDAIVSDVPLEARALRPMRSAAVPRGLFVYGVEQTLPPAVAIPKVVPTRSIDEAVARIESPGFDPRAIAVAPPDIAREGTVAVRAARRRPGSWTIEIAAPEEGTLLVGESWFRAWRARDQDGRDLHTFPLDLDRLGVAVPKGTTRVVLTFGRPAAVAGTWIVSALVLVAALGAPRLFRRA